MGWQQNTVNLTIQFVNNNANSAPKPANPKADITDRIFDLAGSYQKTNKKTPSETGDENMTSGLHTSPEDQNQTQNQRNTAQNDETTDQETNLDPEAPTPVNKENQTKITSTVVEPNTSIQTLTFENEATLDEVEQQQRSILLVDGDSNSEWASSDEFKPSNTSDEAEEVSSGTTRREVTLRRKKKRQRDQRLQEPCQCKLNLKSQTKCKKMEGNTQIT